MPARLKALWDKRHGGIYKFGKGIAYKAFGSFLPKKRLPARQKQRREGEIYIFRGLKYFFEGGKTQSLNLRQAEGGEEKTKKEEENFFKRGKFFRLWKI